MSHGPKGRTGAARVDEHLAGQIAETMQALATPSRVRILANLLERPCSVSELASAVGMEVSAVSHQLRILRQLGLVISSRAGRRIIYALHDPHVGVLLAEAAYHVDHVRLGSSTPLARGESTP